MIVAMLRVILMALATCLWGSAALAQNTIPSPPRSAAATPSAGGYYVEFRVADMGVYGHSYIAYGRLSANGRPASVQYADFHPLGGEVGLAVGHVVPVAAGMQPKPEVLAMPVNAAWLRPLSAAEYKRLVAAIATARANPKNWNAIAYNCNSFVGEMAEAIGLKSPTSLLFANAFVPALQELNQGSPALHQTAVKSAPRTKRSHPVPTTARPST